MQVSKALQDRVTAELKKCIVVLEKKFVGHKFPMPTVHYTLRGTTAGTAKYAAWSININAGLLLDPRYEVEQIEQTVPHELAHLVTFKVYPETMDRGPPQITRRGYKRGKREVHGPRWQHVMRVMGKDPARTHKMDTTNVCTRERVRYEWLCTGCKSLVEIGPKHNKALLSGSTTIYHKGCRGHRLVNPTTAAVPVAPAPIQRPHPPITPIVPMPTQGSSKIDTCKQLYLKYSMLSRSEVLAKFKAIAGCTDAGASTYFSTIKKMYG
jgi:SprT protein